MKKKKKIFLLYLSIIFFIYRQANAVTLRTLPGFPYTTFGNLFGSGAVADLDADGIKEFIIGDQSGYLYAIQSNGQIKAGFPVKFSDAIWSSPAIADIDNDGYAEIIIGAKDGKLYVINYDGSYQTGFPYITNREIRAAPSVADIDKDGLPEIIFPSLNGYIYVLKANGSLKEGWPQRIVPNTSDDYVFSYSASASPLISDYNNDGYLEISAGVNGGVFTCFKHTGERLYTAVSGNRIDASPVCADMDNDGKIEFVFVSWDYFTYVFNIDETGKIVYKTNFPFKITGQIRATPVLLDSNGDGILEIHFYAVTAGISSAYQSVSLNGNSNSGNNNFLITGGASSPALADINNDGNYEFIAGSHTDIKNLQIFNADTSVNFTYSSAGKMQSSPVLNDFNCDGLLDIIVGSDELKIYAFTIDSQINYDSIYVSKFRNTLNNTGNYSDLSTPLIYEPKNNLIHDTKITFRWMSMEGNPNVKSSFSINNSIWSDSAIINEITLTNLADREYTIYVKQFNKEKQTLMPAYRKIIIDNSLPIARIDAINLTHGGIIALSGTADDSNFYKFNIKIRNSSGLTVIDYDSAAKVSNNNLYLFNSAEYPNDTFTAILKVYETDTAFSSIAEKTFSTLNETYIIIFDREMKISNTDKNIELEIPAYTFKKNSTINFYTNNSIIVPVEIKQYSDIYTLQFDDTSIIRSYSISIKYDPSKNFVLKNDNIKKYSNNFLNQINKSYKQAPVNFQKLQLYCFNNNIWQNIGGSYNSDMRSVVGASDKSGSFMIGYTETPDYQLSVNYDNITINRRTLIERGTSFTISNITPSAEISVYDLNSRLIKKSISNNWDGTNYKSEFVSAGLYIILIKDGLIEKKFTVFVK